jgi:hypothetical protein
MATTAGFAGNACSMKFVDGTVSTGLSTDARKKSFKWGYDEYLATDSNINYYNHHSTSPTNDQFWGKNFGTPIFFRQGTVAGSGSDASLSTANIAEAIKEMINASVLGITASRSGSTVSLENDTDGSVGNVTITTTNEGSLFSVSGMLVSSGGSAVAKRLTISARQIALSGSGGLSGSADGKSALMLDLAGLGAASIAQLDVFAFADVSESDDAPRKITFSDLEDAIFGNVSGDATVAAGGALTIAADAVEGSMLNDNVISGQTELAADGLAAADELLISDGGTLKKIGVDNFVMDGLGLLSAAAIDVSADHMVFLDGGATGDAKIESLADVATAMAGAGIGVSSGVLSLDIDELSALGGAGLHQTQDHFAFSDNGTEKKITFSNLQDAVFADVSGDATIAAGGAVTMAAAQTNITSLLATDIKIGEDDQTKIDFGTVNQISFFANNNEELTITDAGVTIAGNLTVQGSTTTIDTTHLLVEDSLIEIARGSGSAGTRASNANAGIYISGSVRSNDVSLTVAADGGRVRVSGSNAVGSGFDIATTGDYAIAGTSVLNATTLGSNVVASSLTSVGTIATGVWNGTAIATAYIADDAVTPAKMSIFDDSLAATDTHIMIADGTDYSSFALSGDVTMSNAGVVTIAADAVEGSMLNDNVISGQTELAHADIADADELMISDGGTLKKVGVDSIRDHFFGVVSGDATVADGGALTIAADAVESGMLNDNVISGQSALGSAAAAQADELLFSDAGTLKKITFSNLEDSIFGNVSGDATVAAGGALTIAADAVEGSMLNDNVISGQTELAADGLAAADELLISDGGTLKKIGVDNLIMDGLGLLSAAAVDVSADHMVFLDGGATGDAKVESLADVVSAAAGAGLQATAGVFSVKSRQDVFTLTGSIAVSGSGPLVMNETPASTGSVMVFFNGLLQTQGVDYGLSGTGSKVISLKGTNSLASEDEVVVKYIKQ